MKTSAQNVEIQRHRAKGHYLVLLIALSCCIAPVSHAADAPPIVSQVIRAQAPIYNQVGKILIGNEPAREDIGLDYHRGSLVHVLQTTNGIIYPPLTDGQPDPRNTLIHVSAIGYGIDPEIEYSGRFATMLSPRPADGAKLFVRVYNMPSLELASFYSDSQLFTVSWAVDTVFHANNPHTSIPIDAADEDGDGLNNSWERWNGSNPNRVDTDGDGMSDMEEFLAGTDSDDWDSFLQIVGMTIQNDQVMLQYQAGRNKQVILQQANDMHNFSTLEDPDVMATSPTTEFNQTAVPVASGSTLQVFRLGVPINEF